MSIRMGALAAGMAATLAMAAAAEAGTLNLTRDSSNFTGNIGGGEYGISNFTPTTMLALASSPMKITGYDFMSFCVEGSQSITGVQPFNWTLSMYVNGDSSKPLKSGTAYLYTNFWNGTGFSESGKSMLSDGSGLESSSSTSTHSYTYDYTQGSGRISSATDLQEAIWWFQGDWMNSFSTLTSNARQLVNAATIATTTGGSWFSQFGANGVGGVRILTLTDQSGAPQQDILVLTIPLPSSALLGLGLMGALGLAGIARRRRVRKTLE